MFIWDNLLCSLLGTQSVLEEKYMGKSDKYQCEPLELVGWEGFFGAIVMASVVLPAAQHIPGQTKHPFTYFHCLT